MMSEHHMERWREAAWQGGLPPAELERLARDEHWTPDAVQEARLEATLGRLVRQLPAPPVSSNFTHRVLQAVEQEERRAARRFVPWPALRRWWPRLAGAGVAVLMLGFGIAHHRSANERTMRAVSLHKVTTLAAVPVAGTPDAVNLDIWENFDVILRMGGVTADEELLSVIKTP